MDGKQIKEILISIPAVLFSTFFPFNPGEPGGPGGPSMNSDGKPPVSRSILLPVERPTLPLSPFAP